jgi:hypothetical protein
VLFRLVGSDAGAGRSSAERAPRPAPPERDTGFSRRRWARPRHRPQWFAPSNESFSGWTKTFTDPRLCAAIVDRLTFAGNIIETGTESYRLAHARAARAST